MMPMCCPPLIPSQAEGQADRSCRAECRAEGCVRGQANRRDVHEHAAEVGISQIVHMATPIMVEPSHRVCENLLVRFALTVDA